MSRKKNHRMRRIPLNASALGNAIANSQPTRHSEVLRIMNMVRISYEKLKAGHGDDNDFGRLAATVNVGMIRAEDIDPQLVGMFQAAGDALLEAARIQKRHGKYGFTGPDILTMNAALELYQQLLTLSSPNQMASAAEEGSRRYAAGEFITA